MQDFLNTWTILSMNRVSLDVWVESIKLTQVDLGLPGQVKSFCSSVTVEIFWRCRSHYKSFQAYLDSWLDHNLACTDSWC